MVQKIAFPILLAFLIISCKSSQGTSAEPSEIILLLKDEVKPNKLTSFDGIEILDQKQTSRSQNQWMIKFQLTKEKMSNLKDKLAKDPKVLKVISTEPSENKNFTNN